MTTDYALAREHMVLSQIQPSGVITPRVLDAFLTVPRELFVPPNMRSFCYADTNLDLGKGRVLLEPMVLAKMIEAAQPRMTDHVLCIGGATGYGAVLMAQLAAQVQDVECDDAFGQIQREAIDELGIGNVTRLIGDLRLGAATKGPYDVILVEGAVDSVAPQLLEQLKPGGRLLAIVVKERATMGQVTIFEKPVQGGAVSLRPLFDAWVPYLPGCGPVARFAFN